MQTMFKKPSQLLLGLALSAMFYACKDDAAEVPPVQEQLPPTITAINPQSGSQGTSVTIEGINFSTTPTANIVMFNGANAKVTSATATRLVAEVPAKAGDGPVTVKVGTKAATGPAFDYVESLVVSTFAGSTSGTTDGTGAAAKFTDPWGIARDANGNLYVAEDKGHRIRKITPAGVVTTFAGSVQGYEDGPGSSAKFNSPTALTVDAQGNIYVAESGGNRIRKITPAGVVSTVAGTGVAGFADGAAATAMFKTPSGIAVDADGNLYVSDRDNTRIRKISTAGVVTTLAGSGAVGQADGLGAAAQFNAPSGLAIDGDGNLYLTDTDNHMIRKITPAGEVTTIAGSGQMGQGGAGGFADGTGRSAQFNYPWNIAIGPDGMLYVSDYFNHRIRMITPEGVVTTIAGSGAIGDKNGPALQASFNEPGGIVVGLDGSLYIVDNRNLRIRKITIE